MKFKFTIEYDGSSFSGWQKQNNAKSIQGELIDAIKAVFDANKSNDKYIDFQGSGRTDSGVHAYNQVAHLECQTELSADEMKFKLNDILPFGINILEIEKADDRFHARHTAKSRQYIYKISKRKNPFERKHSWYIKEKLDIEKMVTASKELIGLHDFISFSDKPKEEKSTKVEIENIKIFETEDFIIIKIKATHFLWKMVRRMVGVLAEVGKGKKTQYDIREYLAAYNHDVSNFTAPASGLFLDKIIY